MKKLKVVLLAGANSIHTIRWANGLQKAGLDVYLISQHPLMHNLNSEVKYYEFSNQGIFGYFLIVAKVRKILIEIQPDIVNAHYASGYGTTARLVGFHPYILSVWGSDIFLFPKKSFVHKWLIKKNLLAADTIASTSLCMAEETRQLVKLNKEISITPFGVDETVFLNHRVYSSNGFLNNDKIVIGTVKSLKDIYGIDLLIRSFALLYEKLKFTYPQLAEVLTLRIVGDGDELGKLEALATNLNIRNLIKFVGKVEHEQVPNELAKLDIYVALSRSESFGVAILEAGLNQCPVVVSNVGGLPELVIGEKTGIIVESENIKQAAEALFCLIIHPNLIKEYGVNAQHHVLENYTWNVSVMNMVNLLKTTIKESKGKKNG